MEKTLPVAEVTQKMLDAGQLVLEESGLLQHEPGEPPPCAWATLEDVFVAMLNAHEDRPKTP